MRLYLLRCRGGRLVMISMLELNGIWKCLFRGNCMHSAKFSAHESSSSMFTYWWLHTYQIDRRIMMMRHQPFYVYGRTMPHGPFWCHLTRLGLFAAIPTRPLSLEALLLTPSNNIGCDYHDSCEIQNFEISSYSPLAISTSKKRNGIFPWLIPFSHTEKTDAIYIRQWWWLSMHSHSETA
jgi:hypothetical protein